MKTYYGTKRITAVPEEKDGQPGYKVVYADGYTSWSPKEVFEEAYQSVSEGMNFGHAIAALWDGQRVARRNWNGKGMWIALQIPDEHSKMSLPYMYMFTADKHQVPWLASQTDILAKDWIIVGVDVGR